MTPPVMLPPSQAEFEAMALSALNMIPAPLRQHLEGVVIQIVDFADRETLDDLGCESEFDLLGLYRGLGLPFKSSQDSGQEPDMIFLYRRAILDYWCETNQPLIDIIRHVMIHEAGHHFGFSDDDMEAIEQS